jgi:di/tripeptidase
LESGDFWCIIWVVLKIIILMLIFISVFQIMATRKLEDKNIRKILKNGDSYAVTIPIEIMTELNWKEKQKVVVKKIRGGFSVKDWRK